jgi:small subunit ribosomal protein S6
MRTYEACCLFRVEEDKFASARDAVRTAIEGLGAQELKEDDMQVRNLAYSIDKIHQGHYFLYQFKMDPDKAYQIENEVRLIPDLMRILVNRRED